MDYFISDYLFNLTLGHQKIMRTKYATPMLDMFGTAISELADKYALGVIFLLDVNLFN